MGKLIDGSAVDWFSPLRRKPKPKPAAPAEVDDGVWMPTPAADVLEALDVKDVKDLLIITRDKAGNCGLISNLDGVAENLLFMEQAKAEMLKRDSNPPAPKGAA